MRSTHDEIDLDLLVAAKEYAADGVVLLTLRRPDGLALPDWAPGAHIDLVVGPDVVRQYSLCGNPADAATWQIAVLREPEGHGSKIVHDQLQEGDTVAVRGPRNHFALTAADHYLFIAGGIGVTPILPMISAAEHAGATWRVVYGGRSRASMAFLERLQETYGDRIEVCPQDEYGLLDLDTILSDLTPGTAIYCCGPEPLLKAVETRCADDWRHQALHVERFAPKVLEQVAPNTSFEVELVLSGLTLTVPSDQTILRVVEEAGVQVLSSCTEGTCGTCETIVVQGDVDHRDSLLTDDEQAANDTMMICVSRARSPRLVLEL